MIRSFRSKALRLFAETAARPEDLDLPGFRFHELKGDRRGTYALSASGNHRVAFRWDERDAVDVDLEDYH